MEPKFQSSFIPKGPLATAGTTASISRSSGRSILGTLAVAIFTLAVLLSLGVFGYERYLMSRIDTMGGDLIAARASLEPDVINKISNLNERITSTGDLLDAHIVLSPLFDYLENSTLKTVRFSQFDYESTDKGLSISMRGQARGYSAVALQSEVFNKSPYLKQPIFADLDLDDKGNVTFTFRANLDPTIVSYKKQVSSSPAVSDQVVVPITVPASTSTPLGVQAAPASTATGTGKTSSTTKP